MSFRDEPRDGPIQIVVDGWTNYRVYSEGDLVKGVVKIDTRIKSTRVTISFQGRADSRVARMTSTTSAGHTVSHAKGTLFRFSETLFEGEDVGSLQSGSNPSDPFVSIPFQFQFPRVVQGNVDYGSNLKKDSNFEHEPGHALPPSMNAEVWGHYQSIRYHLEASMPYTSKKIFNSTKTDTRIIRFIPSCVDPSPALSPKFDHRTVSLTRHSRRLDPSHEHDNHGLRSHIKELFPSSSDPSATFSVTTHVPDAARAGSSIHVSFGIRHEARSPQLTDPPSLRLHGFCVTLHALTHARAPYGGLSNDELSALDDHKTTIAERHWRGEKHGEEIPPVLPAEGEDVDVATLTEEGSLAIGKSVLPTFKTYGLARKYLLQLVLWVECAGKVFEIGESARHPITVLPWPDLRPGDSSATQVEREEGMPPPSYQESH